MTGPESSQHQAAATPLSARLRSETREAHTTAERSGIMRDVLRGTVSRSDYHALLVNLHALYSALEAQLEKHRDHAALAGVNWRALARSQALQTDIRNFAAGVETAVPVPSTLAYVRHIEQLGQHSPALLFPHAYLRYLGDLYGGQIMKRILQQAFPQSADSAFSFYTFNDLGDVSEFKTAFREAIDKLPDNIDADLVVAEAQRGYELHASMFNELAGTNAQP